MPQELFDKYRCDRDRRDYERLVEIHRPLVTSVCRRLLRDPNDVDDVVQETFLKLAGSLDTVSGSLAGWLVATARAASVDLIRREVRERNRRCGLGQLGSQQVEHLATREAIRLRLHDAILAIEPAAREVLIERFVRRTPLECSPCSFKSACRPLTGALLKRCGNWRRRSARWGSSPPTIKQWPFTSARPLRGMIRTRATMASCDSPRTGVAAS